MMRTLRTPIFLPLIFMSSHAERSTSSDGPDESNMYFTLNGELVQIHGDGFIPQGASALRNKTQEVLQMDPVQEAR